MLLTHLDVDQIGLGHFFSGDRALAILTQVLGNQLLFVSITGLAGDDWLLWWFTRNYKSPKKGYIVEKKKDKRNPDQIGSKVIKRMSSRLIDNRPRVRFHSKRW
jgi:hypothetical protein